MSTFAELKANVSNELGLDQTASGTEDTLLGRRLNQAVVQFLVDTHCYIKSTTFALVANTKDYDIQVTPTFETTMDIHKLVDSNNIPLIRVTPDEIHERRRASASTSSGQRYYALDGANMFMIWPTPGAAENLTLYHVPRPTEMSSGSHDPGLATYGGIPKEFQEALEFHALWRMASYDDDASSSQGRNYFEQYQMMVARCRKAQKMKGGQRMPKVNLGWRRRLVSSDPSRT